MRDHIEELTISELEMVSGAEQFGWEWPDWWPQGKPPWLNQNPE